MTVEVTRDWLDYVGAIGAGGSLVLAGIAAWFAWRSAGDSSRSARAAELTSTAATEEANLSRQMVSRIGEQLEIERTERTEREQERQRKPVLESPTLSFLTTFAPDQLTLGILGRMGIQVQLGKPVTRPLPVVVRAEFVNLGDKAADQMLARVAVPQSVGLMPSGPTGDHLEQVDLHAIDGLTLLAGDIEESAHQFTWRVPHMPPNQPEAIHLTLLLPEDADYEIEVSVEHPEAERAGSRFVVSPCAVRLALEEDQVDRS